MAEALWGDRVGETGLVVEHTSVSGSSVRMRRWETEIKKIQTKPIQLNLVPEQNRGSSFRSLLASLPQFTDLKKV